MAVSIYEARARLVQLEQHPALQADFGLLDDAIARLRVAARAERRDPHALEPAYAPLVALVLDSAISPAWPTVHHALEQVFGTYPKVKTQRVALGAFGINAVRELVARAVPRDRDLHRDDHDEDIGEAKLWLYKLASSVDYTAAQLSNARDDASASTTASASASRASTSGLRAPSTPSESRTSPAKRARDDRHGGGGAAPPRRASTATTSTSTRSESPRKRRVVRTPPRTKDEPEDEDEDELMIGASTDRREERRRVGPEPAVDRTPSPSPSPTPPPPPPYASVEEALVRTVFRTIPATTVLAPPADFAPAVADTQLDFKRFDLGGGLQVAVQAGTKDDQWFRSRNHLCIANVAMNLCAHAKVPFDAGQPIVFVSSQESCRDLVDAIAANPQLGKPKAFIHVWIQEPTGQRGWRYKGTYDVAHNGSQLSKVEYLAEARPDGTRNDDGDPTEVRRLVEAHAKPNPKKPGYAAMILQDWDFSARDGEGALAELGTDNTGTLERHLKYVALRNVGWDGESFAQWKQKRAERLARE
ncbi:hypothetical protein JCM11491_006317 [Sporobolomyces phaffii]